MTFRFATLIATLSLAASMPTSPSIAQDVKVSQGGDDWSGTMRSRIETALVRGSFPINRTMLPEGVVDLHFTVDDLGEPHVVDAVTQAGSPLVQIRARRAFRHIHHLVRPAGRDASAIWAARIVFAN